MVGIGLDFQPRSRSTRNAVVPPPRTPFSLSVTATTMTKSASLPLVMKVFSPDRIQSSPSGRAEKLMFAASEPAPGSVIAKQEIRSPAMVGSRYSFFCSSLAWYRMLSASPPNRNGTQLRATSVQISDCMTADSPMPPYSSGVDRPQKPNALAFCRSSTSSARSSPGWWLRMRRSTSGSSGITSLRMKSRTVSRMAISSWENERSTLALRCVDWLWACGRMGSARAAVDVQGLSGDIGRLVAGQEGDHRGDLLGLADPAQRDLLRGELLVLGRVVADPGRGRVGHGGGDEARSDGIHRDAERAEFQRQRRGDALDAGLGRRVVHLPAVAQRGPAGQAYYPAVLGLDHGRAGRLAAQEQAGQVGRDDSVPVLLGHLEQKVVAGDTGVVDKDVESPERVEGAGHHQLDRFGVRDVRPDGDRPAAGRGDLLHHRLCAF